LIQVSYTQGDVKEVIELAKDEGVTDSFDCEQWWNTLRQIIVAPSRDTFEPQLNEFWAKRGQETLPLADVRAFLRTLKRPIDVSVKQLDAAARKLPLPKELAKADFERAVAYFYGNEHTKDARKQQDAQDRSKRQDARDSRRKERRNLAFDDESDGMRSLLLMLLALFCVVAAVIYLGVQGYIPGLQIWRYVLGLIEPDEPGQSNVDL